MQSLEYATSGSQTIAVWPDLVTGNVNDPNVSFEMILSSDYGKQEAIVPLTLLNTPTSVTPRLVFSFLKSLLPNYTGNYTISIRQRDGIAAIWGSLNILWLDYDAFWSAGSDPSNAILIDTDRAWVEGNDVPTYTQYSSPDETGAYIIYH